MQIRCWGQGLDLQGPSEEQDGGQREKRGERDEGQEREARGESRWREERERVIEGRREERKVLDSLSGGSWVLWALPRREGSALCTEYGHVQAS